MWSSLSRPILRSSCRRSLFAGVNLIALSIVQNADLQRCCFVFSRRASTTQTWYEINLKEKFDDEDLDNDPPKYEMRERSVLSQLENIPKEATCLRIYEDVPTDEEWEVLGSNLTSVRNLEMDAGFDEGLNDRLTPIHWPLERLRVSSTCGEVVRNPHILLGKVQHLIFCMTMEVRFEGPSSAELIAAHWKATENGEKKDDEHQGNLKIVWVTQLVNEWLSTKYEGTELQLPNPSARINPGVYQHSVETIEKSSSEAIALTKLEILENSAIETFTLFAMALPRLAYNLRILNIRSTNCCDFNIAPEDLFKEQLAHMDQLDDLTLTIGDVFTDSGTLATLHTAFPTNLRTLRFRGPVSLTDHDEWETWVAKFGDPSFLPNLQHLSFVCDIAYGEKHAVTQKLQKRRATKSELRSSKIKCQQLTAAAMNRSNQAGGLSVEIAPFIETWSDTIEYMDAVDSRWEGL